MEILGENYIFCILGLEKVCFKQYLVSVEKIWKCKDNQKHCFAHREQILKVSGHSTKRDF